MTKIEETRRALYDALAKVRKAKKHPKATDALETALEEHLRQLFDRIGQAAVDFDDVRQERDDCQERMRVIDEAYRKSQEALAIAGDSLRDAQRSVIERDVQIERLLAQVDGQQQKIEKIHKGYAKDRQDLQSAEAMTDSLHEQLSAATAIIGQQEQLIAGQRKAIADMHNELTHRRVIGKAFMQARQAFVALDEALHDGPQSRAMRAVGDDVVDAEMPA